MGIFDDKKSISREKLRSTFRKDRGVIPQTGGKKYHSQQRNKIAKGLFSPKYGSKISKDEYGKMIRGLEGSRGSAKTPKERQAIDQKVRYLREKGGKDFRR